MIDEGKEYEAAKEMLFVVKMELQSAGLLTECMEKAIDLGKDALAIQNNSLRAAEKELRKAIGEYNETALEMFFPPSTIIPPYKSF